MKIIVASTVIPFIEGGGTFIAQWLNQKLNEYGHRSEFLAIPFYTGSQQIFNQMLALRLQDYSSSSDRLIAIRTPSYLLKHQNKVLWFIHHHRGAYDLWKTRYQDLPKTKEGADLRNIIIEADTKGILEAKKIFTNSQIVSDRLAKYNQVSSEVLYPPLLNPERYYCNDYGDYIFYPSRIATHKRQDLVLMAMKYVKTDVKLIVAGLPDTEQSNKTVLTVYNRCNGRGNIKLLNTWMPETDKINYLANCLAVVYVPYKEDSYGYVTLEAFYSHKPVITASDSGGTHELVKNKANGFIVQPDPKSIAETFDQLYLNRKLCKKLGSNARSTIGIKQIGWDRVINRLTSSI
jgi:glycosyltransferase involved in cell wall biosynthesis